MARAGVRGPQASPKGLRHGFGVAAVTAGVPLNLVQKWLGHAQLSTTAIYADAVGEEEHAITLCGIAQCIAVCRAYTLAEMRRISSLLRRLSRENRGLITAHSCTCLSIATNDKLRYSERSTLLFRMPGAGRRDGLCGGASGRLHGAVVSAH